MTHRTSARAACLGLVLGCLLLPGLAIGADPEPRSSDDEQPGPRLSPFVRATGGGDTSAPVKVYTNADLERLAPQEPAASREASAPLKTEPPAEPGETVEPLGAEQALEQLLERPEREKQRAEEIAAAEQRVAAAKQRVAELEKRKLAVVNPYLARPQPPEEEEQAEQWKGASARKRREMIDEQIRAAREGLEQAEAELAALRGSRP